MAQTRTSGRNAAPPPAPVGNGRAAKHYGAARGLVPGVEGALDEILAGLPVRAANGEPLVYDLAICELAARELARIRQIDQWLDEHGLFGRGPKLRPAVEYRLKAARLLAELLDRLGMTPRSRAALGLDLAKTVTLADAMGEKDPEKRRAMFRELGVDVDD
jgi:hypothetical protein